MWEEEGAEEEEEGGEGLLVVVTVCSDAGVQGGGWEGLLEAVEQVWVGLFSDDEHLERHHHTVTTLVSEVIHQRVSPSGRLGVEGCRVGWEGSYFSKSSFATR